jgi:serine/threonine protein kinase
MDFDLAIRPTSPNSRISPKGTRAYRAPEASTPGAYSEKSEAWSLGVMLYQMAYQKLPFEHEMDAAIGQVAFPDDVHPGLRNVIEGLLQKDPARRISLEEAIVHLKTVEI